MSKNIMTHKKNITSFRKIRGISVIEIVISSAIIATVGVVIFGVFRSYIEIANDNVTRTKAAILAEEAGEAIQIMRDSGWSDNIANLSTNTTYYLSWNGFEYSATTTEVTVNNQYQRQIVFRDIIREDASKDISVTGAGTVDPNTRKIEITINKINDVDNPILYTEGLIHNVYDAS